MPLDDNILQQLKDLGSRLGRLERYPQPPTILQSNMASASFSLGAAGSASDKGALTAVLHNVNNLKMFAIPRLTVWQVIGGSYYEWPFETSPGWNDTDLNAVDIIPFFAHSSSLLQHPNDMVYNIFFRNRGPNALSMYIEIDWRFPALEGGFA